MKRCLVLIWLSLALVVSSSCAQQAVYEKHQHYFFGTFDTIITLIGYTQSEEEFETYASLAQSEMTRYHEIFDQYNAYEGVDNLYMLNQNAPGGYTHAEPELIDLLLQVRDWQTLYSTGTNPAMGSVLRLWHNARTDTTYVPDEQSLAAAAEHTNYADVLIDENAGTVLYADAGLQLDLGAVAKGYAAQKVADKLREAGLSSFILNAGGNVICGDAPRDGRAQWTVAVEDVDGVSTRLKLGLKNLSIVTSGDYQRYYELNGQRYHHLIDPATLYPAAHMRSVSVIHPDSGLADFLSTAAFVLPYEESRALIESVPEAEASWLFADGSEAFTDGFLDLMELVK